MLIVTSSRYNAADESVCQQTIQFAIYPSAFTALVLKHSEVHVNIGSERYKAQQLSIVNISLHSGSEHAPLKLCEHQTTGGWQLISRMLGRVAPWGLSGAAPQLSLWHCQFISVPAHCQLTCSRQRSPSVALPVCCEAQLQPSWKPR